MISRKRYFNILICPIVAIKSIDGKITYKNVIANALEQGLLLGGYRQDDIKIHYFPFLLWERKTIFILEGGGSNYTKLGMNQDYLEEFDIRLIEEKQIEEFRESYWILEDCGHGVKLRIVNN